MGHFKDLFATETKSPENTIFDKETNVKIANEKAKIKESQLRTIVEPNIIMDILKKLPLNKSPGPAGVKCELLKYSLKSRSVFVISKFLETILNNKIMPKNMNEGLIIPIAKDQKGDPTSIKNVRGITLSDVMSTIFESYILTLLNRKLTLDDRQYGFRKASSTSHAYWVFEEARRQLASTNKKGYVIFLDFSKAFDKVCRNKMLVSLKDFLDPLEWYALVQYYEIGSVRVYIHKTAKTSDLFVTIVGVKQGGQLSPTAFNKHIDLMIIEIGDTGELYTIRGVNGGCLVYADDTTAITDDPLKMHKIIDKIISYCKRYDIVINEKKTQWMKLGDPVRENSEGIPIITEANEDEKFTINGIPIEKVDRFKLLGNWAMSNGSHRVHISKRIQAAYAPVPGLNELGFNDPKIDPRIIGTLVSTYIRPRLMYGLLDD